MTQSRLESLRTKAKLLQKAKKKAGRPIKLKAAFEIIAKYAGFDSWRTLKATLANNELFFDPRPGAYWNTWYSSYDEAKNHLATAGGFLLPYQKHFFICDIHYIKGLGIEEKDPDLARVGANWVEPKDKVAWESLLGKIKAARSE